MTEGRRNLGAWVVSMLGPALALVLFIGGGVAALAASRATLEAFKETGLFGWIVILATLVGIVAMATIAAVLLVRQRLCSWLLMLPGVTVLLIAAAGMRWSMSVVDRALAGEGIDPSQKARIFAQGLSEASGVVIFGGIAASLLLATSAISIAGRSLSRMRSLRFGAAPIAAFGAGLLLLIADIALRLYAGQLTAFGWHAALIGAAAAVLAAASASGEPQEEEGAGRAVSDLLTIGMVTLTACLAAGLALRSHHFATALGAVAGASVDPSQRVRLLAVAWDRAGSVMGWSLLDAMPAFVGAVIAMGLLKGRALQGLRHSRLALVAIPLLTAVGILVPYQYAGRTVAMIPRMFAVKVPAGFTLIELADARLSPLRSGSTLWVGVSDLQRGDELLGASSKLDSEQGCEEVASRLKASTSEHETLEIAFDASMPWSRAACLGRAWARKWSEAAPKMRVSWIGRTAGNRETLPSPFNEMGPSLGAVESELTDWAPDKALPHVHVEKDAATLVAGGEPERRQGERAALEAWVGQAAPEGMHLSAASDVPASQVLAFAQLGSRGRRLEIGFRSPAQVSEYRDIIASIGTVGGNRTARVPEPVRLETLRANGKLPLEVVRKLILRELPRLNDCHDAGLKRNPKLAAGKLTVRLEIDREGTVTKASARDDGLHDEQLVSCVLGRFRRMTFPEPAKGAVTVIVQLSFGNPKD